MPTNILVTGSSGFVGRHLVKKLGEMGVSFNSLDRARFLATHEIPTEKSEIVIHLAGRAHVLREKSINPYNDFYTANCEYALDVARIAAAKGLQRFVYVSSIGVYGKSGCNNSICEDSTLEPVEDYAKSKLVAEQKLTALSKELGFELVIVRPALVYGYDAPGNIERLLRLTAVLPFIPIAEKKNKRSFVYVGNLVDFLLLVATHPNAVNKVFNIADATISTYELVNSFAQGMELRRLLFSFPRFAWKLLLGLMGKKKMYEQLFENLVLDMSLAEKELGWKPKYDTVASLQETGKRFMQAKSESNPS